MAIRSIHVDQRVIDIDSRRFASIEKALVELITNSDDSYIRLDEAGGSVSGRIRIAYERHQAGALLVVSDQAEGLSFENACAILAYGGAHSPLSRGEGAGRGFFGRGLKQAIYGLGHGWIETIHAGRYARIDLFRGENGGYVYDDGGGDRPATPEDYGRLGITDAGTQVTIVIENLQVNISQYRSVVEAVANNVYMREILERRNVEIVSIHHGKEVERSEQVRYEEPPSDTLLGPDLEGRFVLGGQSYPFTLTLKRAVGRELTLRGDERTNGLLIVSGMAVLDCQLFDFENQVGTEYLYGTVRCASLIEKLAQGVAVISDEREGLNHKDAYVTAFSHAVSRMIAPCVLAEQEKLKHLDHAIASDRTGHMIEHLLQRMNRAAVQDFGIILPPAPEAGGAAEAEQPAALRFTTPFYYRKLNHPFQVTLLIEPAQFGEEDVLSFDCAMPETLHMDPPPAAKAVRDLAGINRMEWTVVGDASGAHGEITARVGNYWAWCEIVVAEHAAPHRHRAPEHVTRPRRPRDHGADMFVGYEFRNLDNDLDRAVYSSAERKILINTGAPTVQLYVDGRGHFRDSARLLLAELFMDVISDELARRTIERSGCAGNLQAFHAAKLNVIRRYGSEIHLSFISPQAAG